MFDYANIPFYKGVYCNNIIIMNSVLIMCRYLVKNNTYTTFQPHAVKLPLCTGS